MVSEKEKLRELRDKRSTAYLDSLRIGMEIRDLEARVKEMKPQDRVEMEVQENWNLTLGILKKVGFISSTKWEDISDEAKRPAMAFHEVRRDVRQAIARSLGMKFAKKSWEK
jgi:hypothetical protein